MRKKLGKVFGIIFVVMMVLSFTLNVSALESSKEEIETIEKEVKETLLSKNNKLNAETKKLI